MIAYKFLARGAVGPFSGFRWPTGTPGPWVEAQTGTTHACFTGIHGCTAEQLPYWLHEELWEIELEAPQAAEHKLVAPRGRLLAPVEAWDDEAKARFSTACLERARPLAGAAPEAVAALAAEVAGDVARQVANHRPASASFCAARLAELVGGGDAYDRERAEQTRWLVANLGLRR